MKRFDKFASNDLNRLMYFIYLVPIFGFFPALWTLYRQQGSREELRLSRMVISLAFVWLAGTLLLQTSGQMTGSVNVPMLLISGTLTSGYFMTNLWLMVRVWQRKPLVLIGGDRPAKRSSTRD